jgi:superfamily I DNA/RNA helicase
LAEILVVTFMRKAAAELESRLAALGAPGVPARTFHAAVYARLRYFAGENKQVLRRQALVTQAVTGQLEVAEASG